VISHNDIIATIERLIERNNLPNLLFYGPPGTGKTSTILACARKVNGPKFQSMVLELNASDDRGIDVVREEIKNFASSQKLFTQGMKLIILDEADAMTQTAQFALRRVMEKFIKSTRFCLICNYVNKIIPASQSRCTRFRFGPLEKSQISLRLKEMSRNEGVQLEQNGMDAIIELAQGDMRKCINVLQSTHSAYGKVTEENVYLCTGKPLPSDIQAIVNILLNGTFSETFQEIQSMQKLKGLSLVDIIGRVHENIVRVNMPPSILAYVLDELSNIEYRLAFGTSDRLQLGALVAVFQIAKEKLASSPT